MNRNNSSYWALQILGLTAVLYFQAVAHAGEYRIEHCMMGCPEGSDLDSQLILRPIYAISFNTRTKTADWVAYKVSAATIGMRPVSRGSW